MEGDAVVGPLPSNSEEGTTAVGPFGGGVLIDCVTVLVLVCLNVGDGF